MRSNKLLLLIVFILILTGLFAQQALQDTLIVQPLSNYSAEQIKLLEQIEKGIVNSDLYNQLGLSYYHQGKPGLAVLWFLRALRINSSHGDAKNNLEYAISQSPDRELYPESTFLSELFLRIYDFFTLNALAVIVLILLILTIICLHWIIHLDQTQERAVPVMWLIIIGFAFVSFVTLLSLKYRDFHSDSKAVIIANMVDGYSGPGSEYGRLFTIHEALMVQISRVDREWALITLPNGGAGWIPASSLMKVRP